MGQRRGVILTFKIFVILIKVALIDGNNRQEPIFSCRESDEDKIMFTHIISDIASSNEPSQTTAKMLFVGCLIIVIVCVSSSKISGVLSVDADNAAAAMFVVLGLVGAGICCGIASVLSFSKPHRIERRDFALMLMHVYTPEQALVAIRELAIETHEVLKAAAGTQQYHSPDRSIIERADNARDHFWRLCETFQYWYDIKKPESVEVATKKDWIQERLKQMDVRDAIADKPSSRRPVSADAGI